MESPAARPFEISIPDAELNDLRARLSHWRPSPDFANEDWRYGMNGSYLSELVEYWIREYDWRAPPCGGALRERSALDRHAAGPTLLPRRGTGPPRRRRAQLLPSPSIAE